MSRRTVLRRLLHLVVLGMLAAVVLPAAGVRPAAISLYGVETAKGVDFSDGTLWTLVLGSDAGGRTDAIQLVGIDEQTGHAVGIGIPRDAWLEAPGIGKGRINEVYADPRGGPDVLAKVVAGLTGITPDLVVELDFDGFLELMGTVGEVEVRTPEAFVNDGVVVRKGENTFDAEESLAYVRYRTGLTNYDFDRSANQQRLMLAALRQLRAQEDDVGFMERATVAALDGLQTDLSPTELYRLAQFLTTADPGSVDSCVLPGTTATRGEGASVVILDGVTARRVGKDAARDFRLRSCPES